MRRLFEREMRLERLLSFGIPGEAAGRQVNEPFLREVLAYIELHPEQWDQTYWADTCGTSHCLAGWAYVLGVGAEFPRWEVGHGVAEAAELLGLDARKAADLFFADHTNFDHFCQWVEQVTGVKFKPTPTLEAADV